MVNTELHIAKLLKPTSNYIPCEIKENVFSRSRLLTFTLSCDIDI